MFSLAGLGGAPVGVKQARRMLRERGLLAELAPEPDGRTASTFADPPAPLGGRARGTGIQPAARRRATSSRAPVARAAVALGMRGVWHELRGGRAILRGADVTLGAGETVALMGRNGSGKSTLLRHAAGLLEPTRGAIERAGRVALLLQNPGDYFLHETVREEAPPAELARAGLVELADRNPRDLSGGERQRLALAIVSGGEPPRVLALDEPTRGMDRAAKSLLADALRRRARAGEAVIVATHDPEFAAAFAERALLMADGRVIADGPVEELLTGGWYFATETARILGGHTAGCSAADADGGGVGTGALLPQQGAALLRAGASARAARGGQAGAASAGEGAASSPMATPGRVSLA
jgi:energy-coupling factor transport system ATP-binding protein